MLILTLSMTPKAQALLKLAGDNLECIKKALDTFSKQSGLEIGKAMMTPNPARSRIASPSFQPPICSLYSNVQDTSLGRTCALLLRLWGLVGIRTVRALIVSINSL